MNIPFIGIPYLILRVKIYIISLTLLHSFGHTRFNCSFLMLKYISSFKQIIIDMHDLLLQFHAKKAS